MSRMITIRVSEEELAEMDRKRGGVPRGTWLKALAREGSLGPSVEIPARSPEGPLRKGIREMDERKDSELERRRKIAATHRADCKCLNCIA